MGWVCRSTGTAVLTPGVNVRLTAATAAAAVLAAKADCWTVGTMAGLDTIAAIMKMLEYSASGTGNHPRLRPRRNRPRMLQRLRRPRCAWARPPIRELVGGWRFTTMVCGVR